MQKYMFDHEKKIQIRKIGHPTIVVLGFLESFFFSNQDTQHLISYKNCRSNADNDNIK